MPPGVSWWGIVGAGQAFLYECKNWSCGCPLAGKYFCCIVLVVFDYFREASTWSVWHIVYINARLEIQPRLLQ